VFVAAIEMGDYAQEVQRIAGLSRPPQFLFCLGKNNSPQGLTPRRRVEEKILHA
jgi:hypothetical protein